MVVEYTPPKFTRVKNFEPKYSQTLPENHFNSYTLSNRFVVKGSANDSQDISRPDVYRYARNIADKEKVVKIIDIGCGSGEQLLTAFDDKKFSTFGIDLDLSYVRSNKHGSRGTWLDANLANAESIERAFKDLGDNEAKIFILSGVLEQLTDPRLLLRKLRQLLKHNEKNTLIVSTPDTKRSKNFDSKTRLPLNESHVREWSHSKLIQFFSSSGFIIKQAGHTRSSPHDTRMDMSLLIVTAKKSEHHKLLKDYGLPIARRSMIITTEHADDAVTGGIGTYLKEVEAVCGKDSPIILHCGDAFDQETSPRKRSGNIVGARSFVYEFSRDPNINWESLSTSAYKAAENLLYHCDEIRLVEYQDYLGVGAMLAEAKRAGQIPYDVHLMVRCHGSLVYTDRASQTWSAMPAGDIFELERMGIRYADSVSFATNYLRDLYASSGYDLPSMKELGDRKPYPYVYPELAKRSYKQISNIVFVGKRWTMKGYEDFCYMAKEITNPKSKYYNPNIETITVLGKGMPGYEHLDDMLKSALRKNGVHLSMRELTHSKLMQALDVFAENSLFCLPYNGDNHPVTVLEMIAQRCIFIAYDKGGIPELIPKSLHKDFLCPAGKDALTKKVFAHSRLSSFTHSKLVEHLHNKALEEQDKINSAVAKLYTTPTFTNHPNKAPVSGLATVMVPIYKANLEHLTKLFLSLNQQTYPPGEILLIDDATPGKQYSVQLKKLAEENLDIPFRIITHPINRGAAAARNTGLKNCKTKYLINIDSDDIATNDYVFDYVNFLESNSEYSVAICALESFATDGLNNHSDFRYIGVGDSYVLGLTKNVFGHSGACVVAADAKSIGGWDDSTKSRWSDWAFYLRLTAAGKKIFNFPKINYFYRRHPASMTITRQVYPAQLLIAKNITGLSRWEALRLYAYINNPTITPAQVVSVPPPDPKIAGQSFTDNIVSRSRSFLHQHPACRKTIKAFLIAALKIKKTLAIRLNGSTRNKPGSQK